MSFEEDQDSDEWLRPMQKVKDPRRFSFAIICKMCRFRCATLQEMRLHVTQKCTSRPCRDARLVDLFCVVRRLA